MERGLTFYISLGCGLVALALFTVALNYPAQLVFESRPYARVALTSGDAGRWTAAELELEEGQLELVRTHYAEFLRRNKGLNGDSSSSSSSSSSDSDSDESDDEGDHGLGDKNHDNEYVDDDDDDDIRDKRKPPTKIRVEDSEYREDTSSESSSDYYDDDSSEETQVPLSQRLAEAPWRQTVQLGLFSGRMCQVMRDSPEVELCITLASPEGIAFMSQEVSFMKNDVNMPMWNNLRVESLFSVITCLVGVVCLLTTLRPCCDNPRLPLYVGSLAFFGSGVLVLMPMVRILLVRQDFERELQRDFNVTTRLMTSWSLVIDGIGMSFALLAGFTMIVKNCNRISRKLYMELKVTAAEIGDKRKTSDVPLATVQVEDAEDAHVTENGNVYENVDERQPLNKLEQENKNDELLKSLE